MKKNFFSVRVLFIYIFFYVTNIFFFCLCYLLPLLCLVESLEFSICMPPFRCVGLRLQLRRRFVIPGKEINDADENCKSVALEINNHNFAGMMVDWKHFKMFNVPWFIYGVVYFCFSSSYYRLHTIYKTLVIRILVMNLLYFKSNTRNFESAETI